MQSRGVFLTAVETAAPPPDEALGEARELQADLTSSISSLSGAVSALLARQEQEYMRAYRAHALATAREVVALRSRAAAASQAADASGAQSRAAAEAAFYQREALRLDALVAGLTAEAATLRDRLLAERTRADALETQLREAVRERRRLEAAASGAACAGAGAGSGTRTG